MKPQSGNVLFMILIAVVLFAALSYAVTHSERSGSGDISGDKLKLTTAQMMQYASLIETTIMRLKVQNGCTDNEISFENPIVAGYVNANAPTSKKCHIFDPAGGGAPWQKPPENSNDGSNWFFRTSRLLQVGVDQAFCIESATTPCADLLIFLGNVDQSLCSKLNNIIDRGTTIPVQDNSGANYKATKFTGTFVNGPGDLDGGVRGKTSYCTKGTDGEYYFYHTLIAR